MSPEPKQLWTEDLSVLIPVKYNCHANCIVMQIAMQIATGLKKPNTVVPFPQSM